MIGILIILYQKYYIYLSIYLISTFKNIRRYIQKNFIVADGKRNGCGVPTTPHPLIMAFYICLDLFQML